MIEHKVMPPERSLYQDRPWCVNIWIGKNSVDTLYFKTEYDAMLFYNAHKKEKGV